MDRAAIRGIGAQAQQNKAAAEEIDGRTSLGNPGMRRARARARRRHIIADRVGRRLGAVTVEPDPRTEAILRSWPALLDGNRAVSLGIPPAQSLPQIVADFLGARA